MIETDLAPIILALIFLFPGLAAWFAFGEQMRERISAFEALFMIVLSGAVAISWTAALLAELELFSLTRLAVALLSGSVLLGGWAVRNGRRVGAFKGFHFSLKLLLPLPIIALAIFLSPEPFEYIVGGRDHGIYVNTGIHIAKTGGIIINDAELAAVPTASQSLLVDPELSLHANYEAGIWSEGQRFPGITVRSLEQGTIITHGFHLYPVWIAVFAAIGGLPWALMTTVILSLLGSLAFYMAAARLFGQPTGLLAFLLLVINLAQVWYAQYPSAEILLQYLFWAGLFAFILMLETKSGYTAVLSGLSFGLMHLTKLDTVLIPVILLVLFLYLWLRDNFRREYWFFIIAYSLTAVHAALHAIFIATRYTVDLLPLLLPSFAGQALIDAAVGHPEPVDILRQFFDQNAVYLAVGLIGGGVAIFFLRRFRPIINRPLARLERRAGLGQGITSLGLGVYLLGIYFSQFTELATMLKKPLESLKYANWYLTPLGLGLGVIGMIQIIVASSAKTSIKIDKISINFAWIMLVGNTMSLFILGPGTYPDQFWAVRRFVPTAFPALILFAAYVLWQLVPDRRENWAKGLLPLGLAGMLIGGQIVILRPFHRFVAYDGLTNQVAQIAASFPEEAVLLFEKSDVARRATLPLWLIFDQTVFLLEDGAINEPDLSPAVARWQADGRDVFWLGSGSETPPSQAGLTFSYEKSQTFAAPLAEGPRGRLPEQIGLIMGTFDVHRVSAETDTPLTRRTVASIAVGQGEEGVSLAEGLHTVHHLPGLTPRRWTSGHVVLQIPVSPGLTQLALMMGNGRPTSVPPAEVAVYLDGTHLGTVRVEGVNNVYTLSVPSELAPLEETAELRLEMEPWTPAQTGYSSDNRPLGVYLDWIKLIKEEPSNN